MTDIVKDFLQDLFLKVYNEDFDMFLELGTEENVLFMHEHIFGKMISYIDIYECAQIIGDNEVAEQLADQFIVDSNKIENIFYKTLKLMKRMKKEGV